MKKELVFLIIILAIVLITGGIAAVGEALSIIWEGFKGFFPVFFEVMKQPLQDYLTSPYFIVGVIMAIASAFGIWFGVKGGKVLFWVVSLICEIASLGSIGFSIFG